VLQLGLFVIALLLIGCIPATFYSIAQITLPPVLGNGAVFLPEGTCVIWLTPDRDWLDDGFAFQFLDDPPPWHVFEHVGHPLAPTYEVIGTDNTFYTIPLWLLSAICLAWPVTSFILARRKPKRGFPVEPKAGGEASTPESSPARAGDR
jgi:hypothetical protein